MRHRERVRGNDEATWRWRGEYRHLAFDLRGGGDRRPRDYRGENLFFYRE